MDWIDILRTPNADAASYRRVMEDRHLKISTRLDRLAEHIRDGYPSRVLLIAHAGDGKSHFLEQLRNQGIVCRDCDEFVPGASERDSQPLYLLNDPSQRNREQVARFLALAFAGDVSAPHCIVAVNRGLLRELAPLVVKARAQHQHDRVSGAADWLRKALVFDDVCHRPDQSGRLAIPLDRRVLVPAPDADPGSLPDSLAYKTIEQVLHALQQDHPNLEDVTVTRFAELSAVTLAMVEATGHHVTFREIIAYAAGVARGLRQGKAEAFRAMFADEDTPPALSRLTTKLRRLDPARVVHPEIDLDYYDAAERDHQVRKRAWDSLREFFCGGKPPDCNMPFRHGVELLRLCRHVGEKVYAREKVRLPLSAPYLDGNSLFRGLARVAWGGREAVGEDVLPLTTPVHPGNPIGDDTWRVLRAAVSIDRAYWVALARDLGEYIETGLVLPELIVEGPDGFPHSPPLPMNLELFERLARSGDSDQDRPADLGPHGPAVNDWLDGMVSRWREALSEDRTQFVVFQTLLGGAEQSTVPLRPPKSGGNPTALKIGAVPSAEMDLCELLQAIWPAQARGSTSIAITPGACATALLLWAGIEPDKQQQPGSKSQPALAQALGAGIVVRLRQRTRFLTPVFPWSIALLGCVVDEQGVVTRNQIWEDELAPSLGSACATALGLEETGWREALRAAWARDEEAFDRHPSALLSHQWLGLGLEGQQLKEIDCSVNPPLADHMAGAVLGALLGKLEPAQERWWLIGLWAAWWLFLRGLKQHHRLFETPLLLPRVTGNGAAEYRVVHSKWFSKVGAKGAEVQGALAALGQACGFLGPASVPKSFDFALYEPVRNLIRLLAHKICRERQPEEWTLQRLQEHLFETGIYALNDSRSIRDHLPDGALRTDSPRFREDFVLNFVSVLQEMGLLDQASDGAELILVPWKIEWKDSSCTRNWHPISRRVPAGLPG